MTEQVKFPRYEELSEAEQKRLRDIVDQGILEAHQAAPSLFVGMMGTSPSSPAQAVGRDGVDVEALEALPALEIEDTPHVLATREESPGVFTHTIAYGRRRFVQVLIPNGAAVDGGCAGESAGRNSPMTGVVRPGGKP